MSLSPHSAKKSLISEYSLQMSSSFDKNEAQIDVVAMRSRDLISSFHAQKFYTFVCFFSQSSLSIKALL